MNKCSNDPFDHEQVFDRDEESHEIIPCGDPVCKFRSNPAIIPNPHKRLEREIAHFEAKTLITSNEPLYTCQSCGAKKTSRNMRSVFLYTLGGFNVTDSATGEKVPIASWCDDCANRMMNQIKEAKARFEALEKEQKLLGRGARRMLTNEK
jgi:hypothetical protein